MRASQPASQAAVSTAVCASHRQTHRRLRRTTIIKLPLLMFHKCVSGNWFVCLDAASYVSTNPLDLAETRPHYAALSFYKIFGYPTGLGALLVRRDAVDALQKAYFGGGSVQFALVTRLFHAPAQALEER